MQPVVGLPRGHDGTVLGRPLRAPLSQHGRDADRKQLRAIGAGERIPHPLHVPARVQHNRLVAQDIHFGLRITPVQHSVGYSEHGTKWNSRAAGCVTTVSLFTNDNESKVNRLSSWC